MTMTPQLKPRGYIGTLLERPAATSLRPAAYYFAVDDGPSGALYIVQTVGGVRSWRKVGGGAGVSSELIFTPGAVTGDGVYGTWTDLMEAVASLPLGALPDVRFVPPPLGPNTFTVPSAGMPADGWDFALGSWSSFTPATGSFIVTIPDGVRVVNLASILNGLQVEAAPTSDYGVFNYNIANLPWILVVGLGAKLVNLSPAGVAALIVTPGVGQTVVYVQNGATINIPPASTGPIVKGTTNGGSTDGIIGVQQAAGAFGGLPDGWLEGTGTSLTYQNGIDSNPNPLIPLWVGPMPPFVATGVTMLNIPDRATALSTREVIWRPGVATVQGQHYNTFEEAHAAAFPQGLDIVFDQQSSPCVVPVQAGGLPWDFAGRMRLRPPRSYAQFPASLSVTDGASIKNLVGIVGSCQITFNATAVYPLVFDPSPLGPNTCTLEMDGGASFINAGTLAIIDARTNPVFIALFRGSSLCPRTIELDMGGTASIACALGGSPGTDYVRGPAGTLNVPTDAATPKAQTGDLPNFFGTLNAQQFDAAAGVAYNGASDPIGTWAGAAPENVQEAIARIAAVVSVGATVPIP